MFVFGIVSIGSISISIIAFIVFLIKWYRNKDYSVSVRSTFNWAYFFAFGINLMLLYVSYVKNDFDLLYIVTSIIFLIVLCIISTLIYGGLIEKYYIKKIGLGITTIAPKDDTPSKRQIEEQKYFESLSEDEKEKWYQGYCEQNKLLNPLVAVILLVGSYSIELYTYLSLLHLRC